MGSACTSMTWIDRKIERSMRERSRGMNAMAPGLRDADEQEVYSSDPYISEPSTRNPSARELEFREADPDRDVLARLEGLYERGDERIVLDLEEAFRLAQRSSREYRTAEEDYIFAAIRYLIERHRWGPRFFNDTSVTTDFTSDGGDYSAALGVVNELRVTQRLPYGGDVEARLVSRAAHQLVDIVGERTESSADLVLSANVPLLRDAGMIAREDILQAERELVYSARSFERFRRSFLVAIARDYFDLVAQEGNIGNQNRRLQSVIQLLAQRKALVEAGRRAAFDAANVRQNVKRSEATLANTRDSFQLAKDRFKVRLGLPVDAELEIRRVRLVLPEPDVSVGRAAELALTYRLDYQNAQDRSGDRKRAVANARNQLLPSLDVSASAVFGNAGDPDAEFVPTFDLEDTDYSLGVTFGLPLDREIERLGLRRTMIDLERAERRLGETRDRLIVDARAAVREIERARFALNLQEEAIGINEERLRELDLKAGEIDAQIRLDAENELLQSRNDRDRALRDLRVAILDYLLVTGQMRVGEDGTFRPLEGMVLRYEEAGDGADPGDGGEGAEGGVEGTGPGEDDGDSGGGGG